MFAEILAPGGGLLQEFFAMPSERATLLLVARGVPLGGKDSQHPTENIVSCCTERDYKISRADLAGPGADGVGLARCGFVSTEGRSDLTSIERKLLSYGNLWRQCGKPAMLLTGNNAAAAARGRGQWGSKQR